MQTDVFRQILRQYPHKKVLVIGDFILDTYIKGHSRRISPEAPVPVVDVDSVHDSLGGAANVALNTRTMGAEVEFCTVTGMDEAAERGTALLEQAGITLAHLVAVKTRSTQAKTRIMAGNHAIVRYDTGDTISLDAGTEQKVIASLEKIYKQCDAVIIADYEKGMITPGIIEAIRRLRKTHPAFLAVDSRRLETFAALKPDLVKPNFEEAQRLLGCAVGRDARLTVLRDMGPLLFKRTQASLIALTADEDGSLWFRHGDFVLQAPSQHVPHPQVSGAGDTFLSAATLALVCGGDVRDVAEIATVAAGIVIRKEDTACCSLQEMQACMGQGQKHCSSVQELSGSLARYRAEGRKIVFTNGCFDILHSGHIHFLQKAKQAGDVLIVGINTDESVRRLKGPLRPVTPLQERLEVLAAIGCIDHIVPFGSATDDTSTDIIRQLRPDLFVKGADYAGKELPESAVLRELHIRTVYIPLLPVPSTSQLISRLQQHIGSL